MIINAYCYDGTEMVQVTPLRRRTLLSSPVSKGMRLVKLSSNKTSSFLTADAGGIAVLRI